MRCFEINDNSIYFSDQLNDECEEIAKIICDRYQQEALNWGGNNDKKIITVELSPGLSEDQYDDACDFGPELAKKYNSFYFDP